MPKRRENLTQILAAVILVPVLGFGLLMWQFNRPPFDLARLQQLQPGMRQEQVRSAELHSISLCPIRRRPRRFFGARNLFAPTPDVPARLTVSRRLPNSRMEAQIFRRAAVFGRRNFGRLWCSGLPAHRLPSRVAAPEDVRTPFGCGSAALRRIADLQSAQRRTPKTRWSQTEVCGFQIRDTGSAAQPQSKLSPGATIFRIAAILAAARKGRSRRWDCPVPGE